MSLEQQISALVSAANNLTGAVNGKMSQIDRKVDEATAAVPDAIRSMAEMTVCVDTEEGDDANDGSAQAPLKTLSSALHLHVTGSKLTILLREGQVFEEKGSLSGRIASGVIEFSRWGNTSGIDKPIIRNTADYLPSYSANRGKLVTMDNGLILIKDVDLDVRNADNGEQLFPLDGFFYTYLSSLTLMASNSHINLYNRPLFGASQGGRTRLDIRLNSCSLSIEADDGNAKVILGGSALYSLGVSSMTLPEGKLWSDLVPVKPDHSNILTNLDYAQL
ncbi:hypothetical protein [Halomonas organivorans]|uniref:Uncharacterized protein n=1 Tax=Halomonas organivorans TaxID=257772 RepID=A0A7W5BYZ6_9GAMM|nr:hypothetical protein [Halomonas organivorans]MBB3141218.1 hypothetical protein [Halomonas organivorans]